MNNESNNSEKKYDPETEAFLASEDKKKRYHRRKTIAIIAIVLSIFLLVPLLFLVIYKAILDSQLRAKLAEIRAAGDPSSEKELEIWYRNGNRFPRKGENPLDLNSNQNGAPLYLQAFKLLKDEVPYTPPTKEEQVEKNDYDNWYNDRSLNDKSSDECIKDKELIITGTFEKKYFKITPLPKKIVALNSIYLQANEPALVKARKAATKPFCIFPKILPAINSPMWHSLSSRRQLARLFSMHARIYAEEGEIEKSIDSVEDGIKLADSFKKEPLLINYLVSIAIKNIACSNIEYLLNKVQLNDEQLKRLSDIISKEPQKESFTTAFKGELLLYFTKEFEKEVGTELMSRILLDNRQLVSQWKLEPYGTFLAKQSGAIAAEQILYIQTMRKLANIPVNNYIKTKKIDTELIESLPKNSLSYIKSNFCCFPITKTSYFKIVATQRICHTAIAVKRYKLKYKKLPDSLQALVPEFLPSVPIDPFDNKTLKYKQRNVTFEQAVKMTEEEKKDIAAKEEAEPQKHPQSLLSEMFNPPKHKITGKGNSTFNKPIDGYKIIEITKPCFLIYSIGDDLDDNGGTPKRSYGSHTDITITVIDK